MKIIKIVFFALFLGCFIPASAQVTVAPFVSPAVQFFDNSGLPLNGGKVCTFAAGTTTPLATYSDNGVTTNANPVVLDSAGRGVIYLQNASYKIVIAASTANSSCVPAIKTQDNVSWANLASTVNSLISNGTLQVIPSTAATSGANQTGPNTQFCGNYWTGAASAADCWSLADILGTGSNPTSTLTLTHSGSSGISAFNIVPPLQQVNKLYNAGAYATISAALTAAIAAGSPGVWIPCGTYQDNITIATPLTIMGEDRNCVTIRPLVTANPVFSINSITTAGNDGVVIESLSIQCQTLPWSIACGDGIFVTGSQIANEINDHITIRDVNIGNRYVINTAGTFGFNNGIEITGRAIWMSLERVQETGSRNIGFKVALTGGTVGPVNGLHVFSTSFYGNFNYAISIDCNGAVQPCAVDEFDTTEATASGQNTALSPCAGVLLNGVWGIKFINFDFEANCPSSTDVNSAMLRITGTTPSVNQIDISTALMVMTASNAKWGIYNDASRSSGTYDGIRFLGTIPTGSIHIANTSPDSHTVITNTNALTKPDIVADANGNTHVSIPAAGVFAKTVVNNANCPLVANKFDLYTGCAGVEWSINSIGVAGGPVTINNFTSGLPNQTLQVCSESGVITLGNAAGGVGQMNFAAGVSKVLQANECAQMRRLIASDAWQEISITTARVLAGAGSLALPSIAFANDPSTGFQNASAGAGTISLNISGAAQQLWAPSLIRLTSPTVIGISSNSVPTTPSDVNSTRAAAGVWQIGTGETANSNGTIKAAALLSGGGAAGLTGTGACATFSTQTGGSLAGRATCTGTTGASTITITPGTTAPTGWVCYVQDETTRANLLQQTSTNQTTCVLTATSVTQNDVFVFTAIAF